MEPYPADKLANKIISYLSVSIQIKSKSVVDTRHQLTQINPTETPQLEQELLTHIEDCEYYIEQNRLHLKQVKSLIESESLKQEYQQLETLQKLYDIKL